MAYTRDDAYDTHKDYKENVNRWEYYIRSYNGGYDYTIGQYLNRYNLELDNEIKKYHDSFEKKQKPKIREVGKFGEDGWSISIGDIDDENTKN